MSDNQIEPENQPEIITVHSKSMSEEDNTIEQKEENVTLSNVGINDKEDVITREREGTFISKTKTVSRSMKKGSMIKQSNFTDNNDYNCLYANLKKKSSKLNQINIESIKGINNENEHKVVSTVIINEENEDEKEINLSEFTEKNSLLVDKFSAFSQQKPNLIFSHSNNEQTNLFINEQKLIRSVILIQTKFRLFLNRQCERKQVSIRERRNFSIPIHNSKCYKTTKQNVSHSIFSTQKLNKIIYINKIIILQRTIKSFLRRKGFYTKVFFSSIRGKINIVCNHMCLIYYTITFLQGKRVLIQ